MKNNCFFFSATNSNLQKVAQFLANAICYKLTKKALNSMSSLFSIKKNF